MTVVVAYKYAANPQDASVGADGVVDWSRAKAAVSEYDPVAVQLARTVAGDSEVVGISVGTAAIASSMAPKAGTQLRLPRPSQGLWAGSMAQTCWSQAILRSTTAHG